MVDRPRPPDPGASDLPHRCVEDLRSVARFDASVPRELDRQILANAHRHLTRRYAIRPAWRWAKVAAIAACILVIIRITRTHDLPGRPFELPAQTIATEDLDRNGRVDILDAFMLARRLGGSDQPDRRDDVNADGRVDAADVNAIAMTAVRLTRESFQ